MRRIEWLFAGALLLVSAAGCIKENHSTLTIREDGTAQMQQVMVVDRQIFEQQMKRVEAAEAEEPEAADEEGAAEAATEEEQLAAKVRALLEEESPHAEVLGDRFELAPVQVDEDTIRIETTVSFESIKDLLTNVPDLGQAGPGSEHLIVDVNEEDQLVLTVPVTQIREVQEMMLAQLRQQMQAMQLIGTMKYVLPGPVVSSTLPHTQDNETWIELDATKKESMDAFLAMVRQGVTIVAEKGELELEDTPLDSRELAPQAMLSSGPPVPGADLPIEEGGEGYAAEGLSVTTILVRRFEEAEDLPPSLRAAVHQEPGCTVRAKLYAPPARRILHLGAVKVERAVDDQGREVVSRPAGTPMFGYGPGVDQETHRSAEFALQFEVPPADAVALEEVHGTAVVTSFADWKEKRIQDPQQDPDAELPLDGLLAGAACTIRKAERELGEDGASLEGQVSLRLTGPREVDHLDVQVAMDGVDNISSHIMEDESEQQDDRTVRTLTVWYHGWQHEGGDFAAPVLVLRIPAELKRERVPFTLYALDF